MNNNATTTQYHDDEEDDSTRSDSVVGAPRGENKSNHSSEKKVRFSDDEVSNASTAVSNVSKFSLKAMRDEVSSKLDEVSTKLKKQASQGGGRDPPPIDEEEAGFEILPNCDDDGNSSITIARAAKDYVNRTPPLQTPKARIKRIFKRKNKLDVITTVEEEYGGGGFFDDDSTLLSEEASYSLLYKVSSGGSNPRSSSIASGGDGEYHTRASYFDSSKALDDNQWKELFDATQKMVYYYFLGQIIEEEEEETQKEEFQPKWLQHRSEQPPKKHVKWARIAKRQSYETIKKLKTKARALPMPPRPTIKPGSTMEKLLIPRRRESFFRDRPNKKKPASEIEILPPISLVNRYAIPEATGGDHQGDDSSLDDEVAKAIDTFRTHAKMMGVNEMELMNAVQQDERSLRTGGFIAADDTDGTVITYGTRTTYQHNNLGYTEDEVVDDGSTVYTRGTLETYAPTIAETEYTPHTWEKDDENLFMVKLVDVFDYYFAP